jgi:hypothetical protein
MEMRFRNLQAFVILMLFVTALAGMALAAQDRYTLKALNGVGFVEFKGYENWEVVAVSETETSVKAILGNPTMMKAYREGVHENGKPFPEGSQVVKIEWLKKKNPMAQYVVEIPDTLKSLSFIEKDSKRFPDSSGWGYAQFLYDPASATFTPYGKDSLFGTKVGYPCHVAVKDHDYIFTAYPLR